MLSLNYGRVGHENKASWRHRRVYSPRQLKCLENLRESVSHFVSGAAIVFNAEDWMSFGHSRKTDYSGEEVLRAHPTTWADLAPGLPPKGYAASVDLVNFVGPYVRTFLLNPRSVLLLRSQWPSDVPKAKIQVTEIGHWFEIAINLVALGILGPIEESEIVCVDGEKVLHGAFGVERSGEVPPGLLIILRFIMNQVPGNSYQGVLYGATSTLTPAASWRSVILADGTVGLWSSEGQTGAFYVGRLPGPVSGMSWRGLMAFAEPVPGHLFGMPELEWFWLASNVIPTGWVSAVAVCQNFHRFLAHAPDPLGAQLPLCEEWRRDRPPPLRSEVEEEKWH